MVKNDTKIENKKEDTLNVSDVIWNNLLKLELNVFGLHNNVEYFFTRIEIEPSKLYIKLKPAHLNATSAVSILEQTMNEVYKNKYVLTLTMENLYTISEV